MFLLTLAVLNVLCTVLRSLICLYTYIHIHVYTYMYIYIFMYIRIHIYIYMINVFVFYVRSEVGNMCNDL